MRRLAASVYGGKVDPFLGNQLCDILLEYYGSGRCPEASNFAGLVDIFKGEFLYEIHTLGKEPDALKKSYEYLKRAVAEDRYRSPNPVESSLMALENLTVTNWLIYKMQTVKERRAYVLELRRLLSLPHTCQLMSEEDYGRLNEKAKILRKVWSVMFIWLILPSWKSSLPTP